MEDKKVIVDTGNLDHAAQQAAEKGKVIKSFSFDEISLIAGGRLEMGPIYNIEYEDDGNMPA